MDLAPIVDRLASLKPATVRTVGTALDLAGVRAVAPAQAPAVFVLPAADEAPPNRLIGVHRQRVAVRFELVLAVRAANDRTGAATADAVEAVRAALRGRVLGWAPEEDADPIDFVRGALIDLADGTVWWADQYRTAHFIAPA